ncbi:hypothetical protein NIES2104_11740 [Leptolyngbya sp. NIES-2104]|nr:hypothetical protein NIES2104_11740 [Leptolyngbya sp. NIES-2104]
MAVSDVPSFQFTKLKELCDLRGNLCDRGVSIRQVPLTA